MKLVEIFEPVIIDDSNIMIEAMTPIWARNGNTVVRKFRCTSGKKQGQIVSNPNVCGTAVDLKKRVTIKKMLKQKHAVVTRKTKRTKTRNPVSLLVQKLNKKSGK